MKSLIIILLSFLFAFKMSAMNNEQLFEEVLFQTAENYIVELQAYNYDKLINIEVYYDYKLETFVLYDFITKCTYSYTEFDFILGYIYIQAEWSIDVVHMYWHHGEMHLEL